MKNGTNNIDESYQVLDSRRIKNLTTKAFLKGAGWTLFIAFCSGSIAVTILLSNKNNEEKNQEPIEKESDEPTYSEEDIQKIVDEALEKYEKEEEKEAEIEEPKIEELEEVEEDTNTYKKIEVQSYKGKNSITSLLKEMDLPTDKKFRAQLALLYGIVENAEDYKGTAEQNKALFDAIIKQGLILIVDENGKILGFKTEEEEEHTYILDEEAQKIVNESMENKDKPKRTGGGSRGHKTETQPSVPQSNPTTGTTQPTTPVTQPNTPSINPTQPVQQQPTTPVGGNENNNDNNDNNDRDDNHNSSSGDNGGNNNPDPQPPENPGGGDNGGFTDDVFDDIKEEIKGDSQSQDNDQSSGSDGSSSDSDASPEDSETSVDEASEDYTLGYKYINYLNLKLMLENKKYDLMSAEECMSLTLTKDDNHLV